MLQNAQDFIVLNIYYIFQKQYCICGCAHKVCIKLKAILHSKNKQKLLIIKECTGFRYTEFKYIMPNVMLF